MIRQLNEWETRVLERLLGELSKFSGRAVPSLTNVRAEPLDDSLTVKLIFDNDFQTGSSMTVPVECKGPDLDGGEVAILLHCKAVVPIGLEIYRPDGEGVDNYPPLDEIEYFVGDGKFRG